MNNDEELDRLEALAEAVDQQLPSSSASSWSGSARDEGASAANESTSNESDAALAAAAASIPRKRRRTPARAGAADRVNDDEDDEALHGASWRDMEDARRFLTADHMERLAGLITRWEHGNAEEGDDVDLNTGLIVRSTGHLQAMAPQTDLALFDEDYEDDDDEDSGDERGSELVDPLFTVCQRPAGLLSAIVESTRQRWML